MRKYVFYIILSFIMMFSFSSALAKSGESICNYIQIHGPHDYKSYIRTILYDDGSVELRQGDEASYNATSTLNLGIDSFASSIRSQMQNGKCFKYIATKIDNYGKATLYIDNNIDVKKFRVAYQNLDVNGFESAKTITCEYPLPISATTISDENKVIYNPINNTCTMQVYVYGDMGALMWTSIDCTKDVLTWIREKRECIEGFQYDPNVNYDLDNTNDGVSYSGRDEYKAELAKREAENQGSVVNTCEQLIGPNVLKLLRSFRNIIMIVGPILALVLGTYDLVVAMASGEEDAKKKGMKKLKGRLIAAALLLLVPYILDLLLNIVNNVAGKSCL